MNIELCSQREYLAFQKEDCGFFYSATPVHMAATLRSLNGYHFNIWDSVLASVAEIDQSCLLLFLNKNMV